ncbi:MAG: DUF11 domain-containing protein [Burkholderiales bacterium]|nr:DUF11 domain-containing protein [Burkholderiales bacterium]
MLRSLLVAFGLLLSGAAYAQSADLSVAQTFTPLDGASGSQFTSTFTVFNNGPDTATNVVLVSTFPLMPAGGVVNFDSYPAGCTLSGTTLTCNLGNMARSESRVLPFVYTLGGTPGVWRNEGTVSSSTPDPNPGNNTAARPVTTVSSADLKLTATGPGAPVLSGGAFNYSLQVENLGPQPIPADATITVQFTVSANTTMTGASGSGWTCSPSSGAAGTLVTCTRAGPMAVGGTSALTINAVAMSSLSSTVSTHFAVGAMGSNGIAWPDPDINNNEANVSISITAGTDVSIIKTAAIDEAANEVIFTLTPRYNAGDPLNGIPITVRDTYSASHFTFASWISTAGWTCSGPTPYGVGMMELTCTRTEYTGSSGSDMPVIQFRATPGASVIDATNQAEISLGGGRLDPIMDNNSSDVTINVNGRADMTASKRTSFSPVVVGQDFEYIVAARNLGPWSVPNGQPIYIEDELPDQVVLTALPTGTNWTCSVAYKDGTSVTYPVTSTTANPVVIKCTYLLGLNVNASTPEIRIPVQVATDGTVNNSACVSLADRGTNQGWRQDDLNGNDCSSPVLGGGVVVTSEEADLEITKTASPATVDAGQPLTYTLTVTNYGPSVATGLLLTDAVSSLISTAGLQSVTITTLPVGGGSCLVGGVSPVFPVNGTAHTVTCAFPSLAVGENAVVQIVVLPAIDATGNRSNTATVFSSEVGDPNRDNNSDTVTSTVKAVYDLTVETWGSSAGLTATSAPANSVLVFVTRTRNIGISRVPTAKVTIDLPANAEFIRLVGAGGATCTPPSASLAGTMGGTLTCEWPTGIAAGSFLDVSYEVMTPSGVGSTVTSAAEVGLINPSLYDPESDLTNNNAVANVNITPAQADIRININTSPTMYLGDTTTYTITVTNGGPSLATDVVMTSDFNPVTAVFSYQGGLTVDKGGTCTQPSTGAFSGQVVCTWPSLNIGESATVTYVMRAEAIVNPGHLSGSNHTYVSAHATEDDPLIGNESMDETRTAVRQAATGSGVGLEITKTASKPRVTQGTHFDYTITVYNHGPDDVTPAHGVQIIDVLPNEVSLTAVPAGCSYVAATRTLTCLVSALLNGADYVVVVPVRVESSGAGPIVNTAVLDMINNLRGEEESTAIVQRYLEQIPTLSHGGLLVLLALLALVAAAHWRRENVSSLRRSC